MSSGHHLRVAAAQISPVFLNKAATVAKVAEWVKKAAVEEKCDLVAFGEVCIPGYPLWWEMKDASIFTNKKVREIHAQYLKEAVDIQAGDLAPICAAAKTHGIAVNVGCAELGTDRGGHTVYCSSVYIDKDGEVANVHRKLMPTYTERLSWGVGDGHGLRAQKLEGFNVTMLNCWENWLPLARAALYGQGSNLHLAIWPGSVALTKDITRFVAMEARAFVLSAGCHVAAADIGDDVPYAAEIRAAADADGGLFYDGGSCLSGPDGRWLIEPRSGTVDELLVADLDLGVVRAARANMDPAGHYSRPDVTKLVVNRERQSTVEFKDLGC